MPKTVDHDARRRAFVKAAYSLFREEGLNKTTMRAIAARAGQTTGALVHYFKDKDEIIEQLLTEYSKHIRERMRDAANETDPRVALRKLLLEALPTDNSSSWGWHNWLEIWHRAESDPAIRQEQKRRYREWMGRIRAVLNRCIANAELPADLDVNREARSLVALIDGLGVQFLMRGGQGRAKETVAVLDQYLARLFEDGK